MRKDYDAGDLSRRSEQAEQKAEKPLKHARSRAEITRVRQGYALLVIALTQLTGTIILVLDQVFHVL